MHNIRRSLYKRLLYIIGRCSIGLVFALLIWISFISLRTLRVNGITPQFLHQLVSKKYIALKQSHNRVSLLLLGMSGGDHEGKDLTDTIEVLSIDLQKDTLSNIAIPRDIWSDTLKDKINSAYHYGEEKKKDGGLVLSRVIIEDVLGIPIHYVLKIDFNGFTKILDLLGGIDVDVKHGFTDSKYPIEENDSTNCPFSLQPSCLYTTVTFEKGVQHMNGERALIYARSRNANDEEGSDFARARRQQEILIALRDRFTHPTLWFKFEKIFSLRQILAQTVKKDLSVGELISFAVIISRVSKEQIKNITIESLFESPRPTLFADRYVLLPIESWDAVHEYIVRSLK